MQEGNLSNLCEGRGETGETKEPRSPRGVIQPLSSRDKGSATKIIYSKVGETQPSQTLGTFIIPDKGSVVKTICSRTIPP